VTTVEGIGNVKDGLHPVQAALAHSHGSQCGFCTPGFVMSMYALLRSQRGTAPSEAEIEDALAGNLCRCTGYRPILEGFRTFAKNDERAYTDDARAAAGAPTPANGHASAVVCPSTGLPCVNGCGNGGKSVSNGTAEHHTHDAACMHDGGTHPVTGVSEPIFPPELRRRAPLPLAESGPVVAWHRPLTLAGLLDLKRTCPEAKLVAGFTEVGIEVKFKQAKFPVLITTSHVAELHALAVDSTTGVLSLGAGASLSDIEDFLRAQCTPPEPGASTPAHATGWACVLRQLRWFAGRQVRNVATLGGNIATGSPISDLNPLWMALGASFVITSAARGVRTARARSGFFKGYRAVDLAPDEVLLAVQVPPACDWEYSLEFKQSHRREDDIALVNAGMRVRFHPPSPSNDTPIVAEAHLAFGGMAACTALALGAEAALVGKPWDRETLRQALDALAKDLPLAPNVPGGMPEFRTSCASAFLFKFFVHVAMRLESDSAALSSRYVAPVDVREQSAAPPRDQHLHHRALPRGLQYYVTAPTSPHPVGAPLMHASAELQVCGEAVYVDDIPMPPCLLHAVRVLSDRPHARLLSLDASAALAMPGVEGFFGAKDVPGSNDVGPVLKDEPLFVPIGGEVTCVGQCLGVIVASSVAAARQAARAVVATYEDLPAILSIDAAMAANAFHEHPRLTGHSIARGDVEAALRSPGVIVLSGEGRCGGQEHFYLEPHGCLLLPGEADQMDMVSSTQGPTENQHTVAHVLGVPYNKVQCRVKRLGGGFGGKESRSSIIAAVASVPAHVLRRPVRLVLDRDEDMASTGQRHPFVGKYTVAATPDGEIVALDMMLYCNGGNSMDLSHSILDRALFHSDNAYNIPNMRVAGKVCATHMPSNTAFRGFGGPQGALLCEMWVDHVARHLGLPCDVVRERNMYGPGGIAHFGQEIDGERLNRCWTEVKTSGDLEARGAAIAAFNSANKHRKRGLACVPIKFGIAFTTKFLNQAGALVHVYTDGTVLVSHGGVEMGQGLHTKMAAVAAACLGVPASKVFINDTNTAIVANSSPSAASASADLYGGAIQSACAQIMDRLAPYRAAAPGKEAPTWEQAVNAAYMDRCDLSAHGFLATGGLTWDWARGPPGNPFNYLCYGAAATEVELDCLTGDCTVVRTDIVMDVGDSLNPVIDVGQIEGGFVQGLGWLMLEELKWGDEQHGWVRPGRLFTSGPGTYKVPTGNDIPADMRVSLLQGASNPRAVFSSKAVGEPPFLLAMSVFFAAKEAVAAARVEGGATEQHFILDAPATPERLRMAISGGVRPKLSC
jgi:xanthine dehydrogenase/oxidase